MAHRVPVRVGGKQDASSSGKEVGTSQEHHAWARVGSMLECPAAWACALARGLCCGSGGGKQGPGKGGLWFMGCSMKIKELCQRLLFLLASP